MEKLEQYIISNVKITEELEYPLTAFRAIHHASKIVEFVERSVILNLPIFHGVLRENIMYMLGNYTILAMHYVGEKKYEEELEDILVYDKGIIATLEIPTILSFINTVISTSSEIINSVTSDKENEFYVSQLILDGIKQIYSLCEVIGVNIKDVREDIYDKREAILKTTAQIKEKMDTPITTPLVIDIKLEQTIYTGLEVKLYKVAKQTYASGDIVKDFFECTKALREAKEKYEYSTELVHYFQTTHEIKQAYIHKGSLKSKENISMQLVDSYGEDIERFAQDFHFVLVTQSTENMDDFLDYLYTEKGGD